MLDFNAGTGEIQGEGEQPSADYADYIYAIGGDTGWSGVYPLRSAQTSGVNNGKYKGFGYLSDQFKFKPNENDWTGDWECVGDGQIGQGSDNCPAPATAGYYMIEVDLTAMTYSLTLINSIGIIGPAQAGGWDTDTDMTYDSTTGAWVAKGVALGADEFKFRANDAWAINWGGALDALIQDGGNIAATAGTYDIVLYAWCDGKAYATLTAASAPAAVEITIDGDMSDWANVSTGVASEAETPVYMEFKAFSDGTNLYFYSKRDNRAAIWASGGYFYYDVDADNNSETGETKDGVPGLEAWFYIKPFAGTSAAPEIATEFKGGAMTGTVTSNVKFKGLNSESFVEVEVSIPIADMNVTKGSTIKVYSWSNKDGYDVQSKPITLTIE